MQQANAFVLFVTIAVFLLSTLKGVSSYEVVGDLSVLKDQFQSLVNELEYNGDSNFDTDIATLLGKLDLLNLPPPSPSNFTLDWYVPPTKDIPSYPSLRITIVVSSFEGMYLNSGIGTFYSSLSDFLVQHGHAVTILYTDTAVSDSSAYKKWRVQMEKRGVKVSRLGAFRVHLRLSALAKRSYQIYEYLKTHQTEFDVVHFPDWEGSGYYSMLAKRDGLAFASKVFITGIHGPWRWVKSANQMQHLNSAASPLSSAEDLETDWMERKSVEWADMVWTPSSDIIAWLTQKGWSIPTSIYKMPYLPGREIPQVELSEDEQFTDSINEIVFFGRLEKRKGLELFADALDRLAVTRPEFAGTKITFLGRNANIGNTTGTSYIDGRFVKGAWPFKVVYVSHKDRKGALEYLRSPTRLAVIPSIVDNTPYTVYECLFSSIPFIASSIPSISSIIHSDDWDRVLFEVDPIALARKIENALDNGAGIARSSLQPSDITSSWLSFYSVVHSTLQSQSSLSAITASALPLVSVCITHYNRPSFLEMTLQSVQDQTYSNFEVILVDDGSTSEEAKKYLTEIEPLFTKKGWQLIRTTNKYLGAARNKAASHANGDYLLFLDDDNLAMPQQIQKYINVQEYTKSDILTAAHDVFEGEGNAIGKVVGRWVPLGASPSLGLFKNCFGDANFFIKKSVFTELGGFTEDRDVGQEDHEFLAKAVLDGRNLVVIPEPLLYYRMHNQSNQMLYTTDSLKNALRAHRPYRSLMQESNFAENGEVEAKSENSDFLKLLAYSRSTRQVDAACNITVYEVQPSEIDALTATELTFNVAVLDCQLQSVRIGNEYTCSGVAVAGHVFTCTSARIPVPGDYPVYVKFREETPLKQTDAIITVKSKTPPAGATQAIMGLTVYNDPGVYNEAELLGLVSGLVPMDSSNLLMVSDVVTPASVKRSPSATDERHDTVIVFTSVSPSATAAINLIIQILNFNKNAILPYRVGQVVLRASCDESGECVCGPSFEGVGCSTPARCPNDCSGNGNCVVGETSVLCECNDGWTGDDCSTGMCKDNCNGHGACEIEYLAGNGTCKCFAGWIGDSCEITNCPGNCSSNPCVDGVCKCPPGINTVDCKTDSGLIDTKAADDGWTERETFIIVFVVVSILVIIAVVALFFARRRRNEAEE